MANTFNAITSGAGGIATTGDASGAFSFTKDGGASEVYIDASGNVGIGTSSPEQLLHAYSTSSIATIFSEGVGVGATVQAISSGAAANLFVGRYDNSPNGPTVVIRKGRGTRASQTAVQTGDNLGGINYQGFCGTTTRTLSQITSWVENYTSDDNVSSDLRFLTRPTGAGASLTERMRIDSSGNVLVGQTSATLSPTQGFTFFPAYSSGASAGIACIGHASGTTTGTSYVVFNYNGGIIGSITQNGTTATAYNTSSDYRLKENVQPMVGALNTIAQLKPVTYDWIADKSKGQGFIAHELQAVVPDCVTGEKDAVDADGNPVYQGIDTSFLVATLTAAIQELKAELDTVKSELATLKGLSV